MIERGCFEDIAFRVISANRQPDHTTIARFRQRHERALAALFGQVLGLCTQAGLAGVAVLAVDGTRVHANASERATRNYQQLAEEALKQAAEIDAAEHERLGDRRGDELPPELATVQGRKKWLEAARRRLDAQREQEGRPIPQPRPVRVRESKRRLEEELATEVRANDAYEAYRALGPDEERPPVRLATEALHTTGPADCEDQHHRPRLADAQDAARVLTGLSAHRPRRQGVDPSRQTPRHPPRLGRRSLRLHAQRPRQPGSRRALRAAPADDRADLRGHESSTAAPTGSYAVAEPRRAANGA